MSVELKNNFCRIIIYPEYGGMLNNFYVKKNDLEIDIIYGYEAEDSISEKIHQDFRGVKLSPFPNRMQEGMYIFNNESHELFINFMHEGNSIHGLLYNKKIDIIYATDDKLVLSYLVRAEEFKGYPFSYYLKIIKMGIS